MRFVKYHGLGNDFIVLVDHDAALTPELARRLCRRGFSIGADGVMCARPPRSAGAHVTMDLVNSDGSHPEMCGNGIRCLVKHAVEVMALRHDPLLVDTPAGVLACAWRADADGRVTSVRVAMGRPRFDAAAVPLDPAHTRPVPTPEGDLVALEVDDRTFIGLPVNTGNPHFVIFGDASRATALAWGPRLETHPAFPAKANIEFVEVVPPDAPTASARLRATVWERGCGLTLACGTGATAATAAAARLGHVPTARPIEVALPGGSLLITIAPDGSEAFMEGPVELAFRGEISQ